MGIPVVPHLQTFSFTIPNTQVLVFPMDRHRTRFLVQHLDSSGDTKVWIGSAPPIDTDLWLTLGGNVAEIHSFDFETGVAGPIYITETGGGPGLIGVVSPLLEAPTVEDLPS